MQVTYATEAAPGHVNEDTAVCGDGWAVVLDGATAPDGVDSGCIHDVPWLVRHISAGITKRMLLGYGDLQAILGDAILETRKAHGGGCDLANPDSPSSTVSIIRVRGDVLDYLVLGDSPVVIRHPDGITVLSDDRIAHLPGGRPYTLELVRSLRNKPGGFWVASTEFEAARQAFAGSLPWTAAAEVGMFTDGVSRLAEFYGYGWEQVFSVLAVSGPGGLISLVRAVERDEPLQHGKQHDDATAVLVTGDSAGLRVRAHAERPVNWRSLIGM